jgi:4-azaleucine resistance transporter AzlC
MRDQALVSSAAFTWSGVRGGIAAAGAMAANSAVYGVIFGALAAQAGFDLAVAVAMSAIVYAGGAQVASLQIWANPIPLIAVWATTFAVNARYILQSASLRPWLRGSPPLRTYASLFTLSDAGWALALRRWQTGTGGEPVDGGFLFGTGAAQYLPWVAGTAAGHILGNRIGSPETYGLDFAFTAFFATMAAGMWRRRGDIGPIVVGAAAALIAERWIAGHWSLLIGGLAGSLVGVFAHERKS